MAALIRQRRMEGSALPGERGEIAGEIAYQIVYSRRRTLALCLYPDNRVIVRAPYACTSAQITAFVTARTAWLQRKQQERAARPAPSMKARTYAEGEIFLYLGEACRLKRVLGTPRQVTLCDGELVVQAPAPLQAAAVARQIDGWYRAQAAQVFGERLALWTAQTDALGIPPSLHLTFRLMKTRWGSCSSRRRVTLNLRLITMPLEMIDYVIAHELCHLREMNHSRRYYALLGQVMPGWKARRASLRQQTALGTWP